MDKNFEIMKAMNYAYDNPENREQVKIHEELVDIAKKSVRTVSQAESIKLQIDCSTEINAYDKALNLVAETKAMENGIEKLRTI
jgi:hypothetical protein